MANKWKAPRNRLRTKPTISDLTMRDLPNSNVTKQTPRQKINSGFSRVPANGKIVQGKPVGGQVPGSGRESLSSPYAGYGYGQESSPVSSNVQKAPILTDTHKATPQRPVAPGLRKREVVMRRFKRMRAL